VPQCRPMLTCPAGFVANGLRAGIKPSGKPDLALLLCPGGATAAAMLTRNLVRAAPLVVTARHLASSAGDIRAVLVNAGCANAATGPEGERRAERSVAALSGALRCRPDQVLVNSTGVIGVQLPVERIEHAVPTLVAGAAADGLGRAAEAIMTTDTRLKHAEAVGNARGGGEFRVVGIAKGAGMIHPDLAPAVPHATMIVLLMTDAAVAPAGLQRILAEVAERTFERISIDGDTSTNDAVFALASGLAGAVEEAELHRALHEVCRSLAFQIARDGEGARKLITVGVEGAASAADALAAARTVATSLLVRTAVTGGDPNWGTHPCGARAKRGGAGP
jgi:glutamate N-acetyltransferase/amino-acid N-acetyltransferase